MSPANCPFQMCQGIGHAVPLKTSDLCLLKAMDVIMNPDQPVQTVSVTLLEVRWSPHQFRNALEKKFPNSFVWLKVNGKDCARLIAPRVLLEKIVDELDDGRKLCNMTVGEMFPRHVLVEGSLLDAVTEVLRGLKSKVTRKLVILASYDIIIAT